MSACEIKPNPSIYDLLQIERRFSPSQHLLISCGCVTVDPIARQVALVEDSTSVLLPKGRKNIGEDLLATALRETYEETGVRVSVMPLRVATRATPTADMQLNSDGASPEVTSTVTNCEPVAVTSYPDLYTGAFKIVFWFAAKGDSTEAPAEGTKEAWEGGLKLKWVDARAASGMMPFSVDGDVIEKVLTDMRKSGYDI